MIETFSEVYYSKERGVIDKGHGRDYVNGYYNHIFTPEARHDTINLLEIGVYKGDSIRLWRDWFVNGNIFGVEMNPVEPPIPNATIIQSNAYDQSLVNSFANMYFDYIIDDGPHILSSQVACINMYFKKLKFGGTMIIEDIQDMSYIEHLEVAARNVGCSTFKVIDLRENVGRFDDVIVEVRR